MTEKVKIDGASYHRIRDANGKELEAVFRVQEAESEKRCFLETCPLGPRILPYMTYARVYYRDEDKVETFHLACFEKEFVRGRNRF